MDTNREMPHGLDGDKFWLRWSKVAGESVVEDLGGLTPHRFL